MPALKSHADVQRYLRACDWEISDDLGHVRLWRHPGHSGKHWIGTEAALCRTLEAHIEALKAENAKLREKLHDLKGKKK